jgi:hypothetical protein
MANLSVGRILTTAGVLVALLMPGSAALAAANGKSTKGVTLEDLPGMILDIDELPSALSAATITDSKDIPNDVKANTGGTEEPVTPDDPSYENLARLDRFGRLGGYVVKFSLPPEKGKPETFELELNLTKTEKGARKFHKSWFGDDRPCLGIGDEDNCGGIALDLGDTTDRSRFGSFRVGRIIAEVSLSSEQASVKQLNALMKKLARALNGKIQDQL